VQKNALKLPSLGPVDQGKKGDRPRRTRRALQTRAMSEDGLKLAITSLAQRVSGAVAVS